MKRDIAQERADGVLPEQTGEKQYMYAWLYKDNDLLTEGFYCLLDPSSLPCPERSSALAGATALVLAGCGGDEKAPESQATASSGGGTTVAKTPKKGGTLVVDSGEPAPAAWDRLHRGHARPGPGRRFGCGRLSLHVRRRHPDANTAAGHQGR